MNIDSMIQGNPQALVTSYNGVLVADSLEVADRFGKRHADVLRTIDGLITEVATQNCVTNAEPESYFIPSEYQNRGKSYKKYLLTRDGFSLLVMGFTGPAALHWKLLYIEAFNKMEQALRSNVDIRQLVTQITTDVLRTVLPDIRQAVEPPPEIEDGRVHNSRRLDFLYGNDEALPNFLTVYDMSLSAACDEARAIFIDNPGANQFEPGLSRSEARKRLFDTLEQYFFTNHKIVKIAVNMNFETKFTAKYGKYILMPCADPFIAWIRLSQLLLPNKIKNPKRPYVGKGLKPMTKEVFGVQMSEFTSVLERNQALFFDQVPNDEHDALSYCCEDSDYAVQHYLYWDEVAKQISNDNEVYPTYSDWLKNIEMPFTRVTGIMEYWGMKWDSDIAQVKREEAKNAIEIAAQTMKDLAASVGIKDLNVGVGGKTKDVKSFVFDTLKLPAAAWSDKTKDPSLDSNALMDMIFMLENKLEDPDEEKYLETPLPEEWEMVDPDLSYQDQRLLWPREYTTAEVKRIRIARREEHPYKDIGIKFLKSMQTIQKYATLLSSHVEGREKYVNPVTGRIHAKYEPWTETARLASNSPNGQNVPRPDNDELGVRNFYKAEPGKVFLLEDESGFELRLTAWKSGCEVMRKAFRDHEDLHRKTAATMTGKPEAEVTKHERSGAKAGNFGSVYGGTEHALQKTFKKMGLRKSLPECKKIVDAVMKTYPGIPRMQVNAKVKARETGYAETIYGYKRLLPAINSKERTCCYV